MEKVLYCDFDGTLIQENSEQLLVSFLMETGYFKLYHYMAAVLCKAVNLPRRLAKRGAAAKAWSIGLTEQEKSDLIGSFWDKHMEGIHVNSKVLKTAEDFDGKRIILTGSDRQLVYDFLRRKGIADSIDDVIGAKTAAAGFKVLQHPYGRDKCLFLDPSVYKAGIGNEAADIFFLSQCDQAYIVPGDPVLENIAAKNGWRVI